MSYLKPITDLALTGTNSGDINLRQTYELAARMIESAANRQADLLKKEWAALHETPFTPEANLSEETWYNLRQMGESYWEVRSAGITSLNGDGFGLKKAFLDHVFKVYAGAVMACSDRERDFYGLTNGLIHVVKFMDLSDDTVKRLCSIVEQLDPRRNDRNNAALQKVVIYHLQYRSMNAAQDLLAVDLAYRIQEAKGLALPEPSHRQQKPEARDLLPRWQFKH